MKKFLPYILIFIMSLGMFGQIVFASVDIEAKGDCYIPRNHDTIPLTTKDHCEKPLPDDLGGIWTQTTEPSCYPPKILINGDCQIPIPTPATTEVSPSSGSAAGQAPKPSTWGTCRIFNGTSNPGSWVQYNGRTKQVCEEEARGLYADRAEWKPETGNGPTEIIDLTCTFAAQISSDPNWGWENGKSCKNITTPLTSSPLIKSCNAVDKNGNCLNPKSYILLAPLPCDNSTAGCENGKLTSFDPTQANNLGAYLNIIIRIFIGLCAVLAVIMIVMGGIEYMTSELISNKEEGKKRILGAIFGLVLALGAYTLLYTINPDILNTDLKSLAPVTVGVDLGAFSDTPSVPIQKDILQKLIPDCTGSGGKDAVAKIADEFRGKTNYSMPNRNTISGSIINLDCTSFVDQVYSCAGLTPPYITSGNITTIATSANGKKIDGNTFDFNTLNVGDLVGWEGNSTNVGHMAIYIGGGYLIDTNSHTNTDKIPVSQYKDRITFVMWPEPKK